MRPCDINAALIAAIAALASASIIVPPEGLGTAGWRSPTTRTPPTSNPEQTSSPCPHELPSNSKGRPAALFQALAPGAGATNRQPPSLHAATTPSRPAQPPLA